MKTSNSSNKQVNFQCTLCFHLIFLHINIKIILNSGVFMGRFRVLTPSPTEPNKARIRSLNRIFDDFFRLSTNIWPLISFKNLTV